MKIGSLFSGIGGLASFRQCLYSPGMPRGSKPKVYDPVLVERVSTLYSQGMSQEEVAREIGVTQKVVWNLMRRHGLKTRPQVKRDQRGKKNTSWKGDDAGYSAMHLRVQALRGKPSCCSMCDTTSAKRFEWANLTGDFSNPYDYVRTCSSCHHRLDGTVRNLRGEVPDA